MDAKTFYKNLKQRDRRALREIVQVLKEYHISDISAIGEAVKPRHHKKYKNINLLLKSVNTTGYILSLEKIRKRGANIHENIDDKFKYNSYVTDITVNIKYNRATKIGLSYTIENKVAGPKINLWFNNNGDKMNMENFFSGIKQNCVKEIYDVIKSFEMEFAFYRQKDSYGNCIGCMGILVSTPNEEVNTYYSLVDKLEVVGFKRLREEKGFEGMDHQFIIEYDNIPFKIGNLRNGTCLINGTTLGQNPINRWKLDPRVVHDHLSAQEINPYMVLFNSHFFVFYL